MHLSIQPARSVAVLTLAAMTSAAASCAEPDAGVSNDSAPAEAGRLTASEVVVLATSESLARVMDLEVLPDGRVWVMNSVPPYFVGFDTEGREIAAWGTEGGGPEEFRLPAGFVVGGLDDQAWVFDARRHALIRIAGPGAPWTEVSLPRETLPPGTVQGGMSLISPVVRTAHWNDRIVLPHSTGSLQSGVFAMVEGILKADLLGFDRASGEITPLLDLGSALDDPFSGFEATDGGFPLWRRLWGVCGDRLRVYNRVRHQLRGFDPTGAEVAPIDLPGGAPTTVSPEEFARAVFPLRQAEATGGVEGVLEAADSARLVNQMAQGLQGSPEQLAAYMPTFVDFRCSPSGDMWLQPLDLDAGGLQGTSEWLRVGADGSPQTVGLPERFRPFRFLSDRVWGVLLDEFDVASIAWVGVP